ncbi:MAG: hypothetical protein WAL11_07315, partial [Pseudolabrys sp.]
GCHAAHLLSAFRLSDSALVGNGVIQRYRRTEEFSAAVRGFHVDCFRMGHACRRVTGSSHAKIAWKTRP